ncbi:PREDICTED: pentatricopeptide repeat-containing [Prunus dulcis]|uniref:PREDICTED: pentatricopeptide repeat-containing n=1 Tax=Prunus dulcis TaxID=3755 RepID=A0A5E4FEA4_PRUDU|nr:PREDICTED: pentatricopeptide repeat-containing [Prunus dulcis]
MWKNYITEPEAHLVPKAIIFSRNFLKTLPTNRVVGFSVPHFASSQVPPHNPTSQRSKLISKVQPLPHFFANCFTPEPTRANTQAFGISPNVVTFNTLIDGYCKWVGWETCKYENVAAAMKVFKAIRKQGLKPNVITEGNLSAALNMRAQTEKMEAST